MGPAKFSTSSAELLCMRMSSTCARQVHDCTFIRSAFAHASVSECARECGISISRVSEYTRRARK